MALSLFQKLLYIISRVFLLRINLCLSLFIEYCTYSLWILIQYQFFWRFIEVILNNLINLIFIITFLIYFTSQKVFISWGYWSLSACLNSLIEYLRYGGIILKFLVILKFWIVKSSHINWVVAEMFINISRSIWVFVSIITSCKNWGFLLKIGSIWHSVGWRLNSLIELLAHLNKLIAWLRNSRVWSFILTF